jgi:hypothetical protein
MQRAKLITGEFELKRASEDARDNDVFYPIADYVRQFAGRYLSIIVVALAPTPAIPAGTGALPQIQL